MCVHVCTCMCDYKCCRHFVLIIVCLLDLKHELLKDHMIEGLDYSLVPEEGWKKFVSWYGIEEASRPIPRYVVEHGMYVRKALQSGGVSHGA